MSILDQIPNKTNSEEVAITIKNNLVNMMRSLVKFHSDSYRLFWNNPKATPQEISIALGAEAATLFAFASENINFICKILSINHNKTITLDSPEFLALLPANKFALPLDKYNINITLDGVDITDIV